MTAAKRGWLASLVAAAGIAAVVGGFLIVGSPGEARLRRIDDRRVTDLGDLQRAIDVYRTRTGTTPATLEALVLAKVRQVLPADPVTRKPYEYSTTGDSAFELCATFDRASAAEPAHGRDPLWSYGAGRQCFPLVAKDLNRSQK